MNDNPLSYSRIVHPRYLYKERLKNPDEAYLRAASTLERWIRSDVMIDDTEEAYYLYRLEYRGHIQTGIVCRTSIDDILNKKVRAHENVRENKLADLAHHIELCRSQVGGPILMAYRQETSIRDWISRVIQCREPQYHFLSENQIWNTIWRIGDPEECRQVEKWAENISGLYIADGHHRVMAAVRICQNMRRKNPDFTGREAWNYVTCVCFAEDQLQILPYSRIVSDRNGLSVEELLKRIRADFRIEEISEPVFPEKRGDFVMVCGQRSWCLHLKEGQRPASVPDSLDVAVLQTRILEPILGINNDRKDSRLEYMGGEQQREKVLRRCENSDCVGFFLYPTAMEEILQVADGALTMPPKSTWFSPKLCNGLFIYRIFPRKE